ncbi:hypothetical protein ES708_17309 [subsurface metagenome]
MSNFFNISVKPEIDAIKEAVDAILLDTAAIQPKLPTDYIMGSAVLTSKNADIDDIKVSTDRIPAFPAEQSVLNDVDSKLDTLYTKVELIRAITDALSAAPLTASANITEIVPTTVLFVASGSGFLTGISTVCSSDVASLCNITITIDGVALDIYIPSIQASTNDSSGSGLSCIMRFNTSLKVEANVTSEGATAHVAVAYTLE